MFGKNKPFNSKKEIISIEKKLKAESIRKELSERNRRKQEEIAKREQRYISHINKIASLEAHLSRLKQSKSQPKHRSSFAVKPETKPRTEKAPSENEQSQQKLNEKKKLNKTDLASVLVKNILSSPTKNLKTSLDSAIPVTDRSQNSKQYVAIDKKVFEHFLLKQMNTERTSKSFIADSERKIPEKLKSVDFFKPLATQVISKSTATVKKIFETNPMNSERLSSLSKTYKALQPETLKNSDLFNPLSKGLGMDTSEKDRQVAQNRRRDYSEKVRKEVVPEISEKKKTELDMLKEKFSFRRPLLLKRTKLNDLF